MSVNKTDGAGNNAPIKASLVRVLDNDTTLSHGDSGGVFCIATDAKTITLPPTKAGTEFTFVNTGADGANIVTVSPQAADGIAGTITLASTVVARPGTVNTDLVNTKSTSKLGDSVRIIGTGVPGTSAWIIIGSTGIWA